MPEPTIEMADVKSATTRLVQAAQFCGQQETAGPFIEYLRHHRGSAAPEPDQLRALLGEAALFVTAAAIWLSDHPEALPGIAAGMASLLAAVPPG